ncbi:MAG TPA: MerR family transcriptional regulator [Pseudonocardiaceae bacterium]|jgi:DNA-binding transcriptional MerR regulator
MFSIGDFARYGRVSIRMLRHYDAIGLLRPAHIDPANGYRFYQGSQLARLNRIIALKDLGFTLEQVQKILDEEVSAEQLRGMLRLRRAELEAAIASDAARLVRVEARLRTIESEGHMPSDDVVIKRLPSVRVAELTGTAASFTPEDIGPVVQPLCADLGQRLADAGVSPTGPLICYYEDATDGHDKVVVHAAVGVAAVERGAGREFAIVDLPEVPTAATIVHRGSMDNCLPSHQAVARWIDANGYHSAGPARELYIECPADGDQWVTELQYPITTA